MAGRSETTAVPFTTLHFTHGEVGQGALLLRVLRAAGGSAADIGEVPYSLGVVNQVDRGRIGDKAGDQQLAMEEQRPDFHPDVQRLGLEKWLAS